MPSPDILFYLLLFGAAFLYASIGHGGASGYLAIMALYHFAPEQMKPIALSMNLFVSLIAFSQFYKAGYFQPKMFLPLAIASIPMAFIGGSIHINISLYKIILGIVLVIIATRFLLSKYIPGDIKHRPYSSPWLSLIGGSIGFLSGLIGIGGGVLLSPVLLLLSWANQKQAACISALFIFVNSAAGLLGQRLLQQNGVAPGMQISSFILTGIAGSLLGAYLGAGKLNNQWLKYFLSVVLLIAGFKLVTG